MSNKEEIKRRLIEGLSVHQRGPGEMPEPELSAKEQIRQRLYESIEDARISQGVSRDMLAEQREAMTTPAFEDATDADFREGVMTPEEIERQAPMGAVATMADKTRRKELARQVLTGGEILLGGASGGAGPIVGRGVGTALRMAPGTAKRRLVEAAVTGAVEAAISAVPGLLDPERDPGFDAKVAFALGGLGDLAASSLVNAIRTGDPRYVDKGAREAIDQATRRGDPLPSVGRLTQRRGVDLAENFAENSLFGGQRVTNRNLRAEVGAQEAIDDYVVEWTQGASRSDVDKLVMEVRDDGVTLFKDVADKYYGQLDELDAIGVSTDELISARNKIVSEAQGDVAGGQLKELIREIDKVLGVAPDKRGIEANIMISSAPRRTTQAVDKTIFPAEVVTVRDAEGRLPWRTMQRLRSSLLRVGRSSDELIQGQVEGAADSIAGSVDSAMTRSAAEHLGDGSEAFLLWREANDFYKSGAQAFNDKVIASLALHRPDDFFNLVFQADSPQQVANYRRIAFGGIGNEDPTTIAALTKRARRVLRDPNAPQFRKEIARLQLDQIARGSKAWKTMQGHLFRKLLQGADQSDALLGSQIAVRRQALELRERIANNPGTKIADRAQEELDQLARTEKIEANDFIGARTRNASTVLDRFNAMGNDTLNEIFKGNPRARKNFEKLLRVAEVTQSGTGLGVGTFATQMAQAGAVFVMATGPGWKSRAKAALIIMAGDVIGRLIENERFIRAATVGAKIKPGTERAARVATQMALQAARAGATVISADGERLSFPEMEAAPSLREVQSITERRAP